MSAVIITKNSYKKKQGLIFHGAANALFALINTHEATVAAQYAKDVKDGSTKPLKGKKGRKKGKKGDKKKGGKT